MKDLFFKVLINKVISSKMELVQNESGKAIIKKHIEDEWPFK